MEEKTKKKLVELFVKQADIFERLFLEITNIDYQYAIMRTEDFLAQNGLAETKCRYLAKTYPQLWQLVTAPPEGIYSITGPEEHTLLVRAVMKYGLLLGMKEIPEEIRLFLLKK